MAIAAHIALLSFRSPENMALMAKKIAMPRRAKPYWCPELRCRSTKLRAMTTIAQIPAIQPASTVISSTRLCG